MRGAEEMDRTVLKISLLLAICLFGHAAAQTTDESFSALARKDYQSAFRGFSVLSEKGDPIAQGVLATMYENGWGTLKSANTAFYWNYQAAEQGLWTAQFSTSSAYLSGDGVAKDIERAYFWLKLACRSENAQSKSPEKCAYAETLLSNPENNPTRGEVRNWRLKTAAQAKSLALAIATIEKKTAVEISKFLPAKSNPLDAGSDVFSKVSPSVFLIRTRTATGALQGSGVAYKYGYGRDFKPDRTWIATNAHVVAGSTSVTVESSGRSRPARVEYADADLDLALIVVEGEVLPLAKISKATKPAIGSRVFAIGSPFGLENTISEGLLSGIRESKNVKTIQTSAAISSGNSGGGLFDTEGQLLGITTFKLKGGENLNFAVDSSYIEIVGEALLASGLIRASYERKVVRTGDEDDLDERYIESPNLTRWLLERVAPDGTPMYVYFNHLFREYIKTGRLFSAGDKIFDQILRDFLSGRPKTARSQNSQSADGTLSATYRLNCPMYASSDRSFQFDLNVVVDVANSKVNGRQANITDSEIIFMTGKDFGFTAVLNRYSARVAISSVQTPSLLTGTCVKLADRQL